LKGSGNRRKLNFLNRALQLASNRRVSEMNLRHIDPRSTEWMETIEEMLAREDSDEEDTHAKVKAGDSRGGRLASGSSPDHGAMSASSTLSASSTTSSRR
jgi:hypothetical protein